MKMSFWIGYLIKWAWIVGFLVVAVACHELGHYYAFKKLGRNPKIRFVHRFKWRDVRLGFEIGDDVDYQGLTIVDLMRVYTYGVFIGAVIIVLGIIFVDRFLIMALVLYFFGSRDDLLSVLSLVNAHKKELMEERGVNDD